LDVPLSEPAQAIVSLEDEFFHIFNAGQFTEPLEDNRVVPQEQPVFLGKRCLGRLLQCSVPHIRAIKWRPRLATETPAGNRRMRELIHRFSTALGEPWGSVSGVRNITIVRCPGFKPDRE
jgi:hypothetical protein